MSVIVQGPILQIWVDIFQEIKGRGNIRVDLRFLLNYIWRVALGVRQKIFSVI